MATTENGTVELPTEATIEPSDAETQAAIERLLGQDEPEITQQSEATENVAPEKQLTPETEPQSSGDDESSSTEAADEDAGETDSLPEDVQARIDRRIAKVVAKRKEVEEQLAERESRLAEAEAKIKELSESPKQPEAPPKATPDANDPLLQVPEIKRIWDEEQKASTAVRTASELLRKIRRDPEAGLNEFNKLTSSDKDLDDAKEWLENAKENARVTEMRFAQQRAVATERHIAKMEKEADRHNESAKKVYPWLGDTKAKEFKTAKEILQRFPALSNPAVFPDGALILGDLVYARLARDAKLAAPPAAKPTPPKLGAPARAAAPMATGPAKPNTNTARQKLNENSSPDDILRVLEAIA